MVFLIAVIAFMTYRDVLGYFFTGIDTIAIIESVRIQSAEDIMMIFSRPLASDTPMPEVVQACYRPFCSLLFSLDYAIWGLNPFGYNLTNVLLHVLVSVLCFFVVRVLTKKTGMACISSIIFASHPVLVEGVSATVRRCDTLTTLFILLSLFLFLRYSDSLFKKRGHLILSILFYVLALGTKEIAVIFPFMIFTYLISVSFSGEGRLTHRFSESLKKSLPYLAVTLLYLALRTYIIRGIGGYVGKTVGFLEKFQTGLEIFFNYFANMLYPVDFLRLNALFSPFPGVYTRVVFLVIFILYTIAVIYYRKRFFGYVSARTTGAISPLITMLAAIMSFSIAGIVIYPLTSPYINDLIKLAYEGSGPSFITAQMNNIGSWPVETYIYKFRNLFLRFSLVIFSLSAAGLLLYIKREEVIRSIQVSGEWMLMPFLFVWIVLPLGVYLVTFTSGAYYLYISMIPFAVMLSIVHMKMFYAVTGREGSWSTSVSDMLRLFSIKRGAGLIVTTGLIISLLAFSPLFRVYGEWKDSGLIIERILYKFVQIYLALPPDAVIRIYNYPDGILSYETEVPRAREVGYPNFYNIESWMKLHYPSFSQNIKIESRQKLMVYPEGIELELREEDERNVSIVINYDFGDR